MSLERNNLARKLPVYADDPDEVWEDLRLATTSAFHRYLTLLAELKRYITPFRLSTWNDSLQARFLVNFPIADHPPRTSHKRPDCRQRTRQEISS